jgi:hypothetical protein
MIELTFELLKEINIGQIFVLACLGWFYYSRLKNEMDRRFEKVDNQFDKIDGRFEKVNGKFEKVDIRFDKVGGRFDKMESRLGRLEMEMVEIKTILRLKECCMIHDERQIKKAE